LSEQDLDNVAGGGGGAVAGKAPSIAQPVVAKAGGPPVVAPKKP
jgi:hypothetical protein